MIYLLVASLIVVLLGIGIWLAQRQSLPAASSSARGGNADEVDDELRGVFIAEVKSEIGNLRRNLLLWRAAPSNLNRLMPLRRSFHTLKGSSRMVGVPALGDFNARFERLLDRVIDKSLYPDPPVVAVVEQAVAALPELLAQFEGIRTPRADIAGIMKTADRLIKSERNTSRPLRPTTPPPPSSDHSAAALATTGFAASAFAAPSLQAGDDSQRPSQHSDYDETCSSDSQDSSGGSDSTSCSSDSGYTVSSD